MWPFILVATVGIEMFISTPTWVRTNDRNPSQKCIKTDMVSGIAATVTTKHRKVSYLVTKVPTGDCRTAEVPKYRGDRNSEETGAYYLGDGDDVIRNRERMVGNSRRGDRPS